MTEDEIEDLIQLSREWFISAAKSMESARAQGCSSELQARRRAECAEWAAIYTAALALRLDPDAKEPIV